MKLYQIKNGRATVEGECIGNFNKITLEKYDPKFSKGKHGMVFNNPDGSIHFGCYTEEIYPCKMTRIK